MEANNINEMREALKVANETADELLKWIWNHYQELNCMGSRLKRAVEAALAKPARACDLMTEEELSRVVSRSIVASVSSRPELNEEWIKSLVDAAVTAAIKCAYDTQLKSSKESNNDD